MLRSRSTMADSNNDELIGFIAGRFEAMADRLKTIEQTMATKEDLARLEGRADVIEERMATKDDLARLDGRLNERLEIATTSIRGDLEQVQLRLDSMEHSIVSRYEQVEGEISRLRSAVYVLGKDRPDVLRLLGRQAS
jgi:hypothetical protein